MKKIDFLKWSTTQRDLLFLLLFSAILKTTMALFIPAINHDGPVYIAAAQKIASGSLGEGIRSFHMPYYPLLIVFIHAIIPNWVVAAHVVSLLTSVFTIIPLYLLTRDSFGRESAVGACVAFTLIPVSNHLSVEIIKDPSFLFFFAWAVYFAQRAIQLKKLIYFFLASLFSLFSILFRLEGIIIFVAYVFFLFVLLLRTSEQRIPLLKGMIVYLGFPMLIVGISFLVLRAGWSSTLRLVVVIQMVQDFINLKFLSNYMAIYKELEVFETALPQKGGVKNFAEIAREYLFFVYLIGSLESLVKALFPLYLFPLGWGLWHSRMRKCSFVLFLASIYFLMLYYLHVKTDSIRERFFLSLVFLLCPWVGVGLERLFDFVKRSPQARILTIICVLLFGVLPIYKSIEIVWKQDNVFVKAGEWIGKVPEFQKAAILSNDKRIAFYAGHQDYYAYHGGGYDNLALENIALAKGADLLVIKRSKRKRDERPHLKVYKEVKEFVGVKDIIYIYCSPKLCEVLDLKNGY
ncbi:MAG: glycosyltransferase family 39 protein [Syntrophobacterales bacterium]